MDECGIESGGMSETLDEYKQARFSERGVNNDGMENGHKMELGALEQLKRRAAYMRLHWLLACAIKR